jgi:hypothetical protein
MAIPKKEILTPAVIEAEAVEAGGGLVERVESSPFPALWLGLSATSFAVAGIAYLATRRKAPAITAGAIGALFLAIGACEGMMSNIEESEVQKVAYH